MEKNCLFCGKELKHKRTHGSIKKYCSPYCSGRAYYYNNYETQTQNARDNHYKNFERDKERKYAYRKEWGIKNREDRNKKDLAYYHKHKAKCNERTVTSRHKKEISTILPNICANCGKKEGNVIHHKEYGHYPKYVFGLGAKEINRQNREQYYKKYLLLFCSTQCHRGYERKLSHRNLY